MKSETLTHINKYVNGTRKQNADSTYSLRIPLTVADYATAHFNDTNVLSFVCGLHKLFWIPQILLQIPQIRLFLERFERDNDLGICLWNPKQHRRSKKSSNVADSASNLILACCGCRLQCREGAVWPRNDKNFPKVPPKGGGGRARDEKTQVFGRFFSKIIKNLFWSVFCLRRRNFGQNGVFIVVWESS